MNRDYELYLASPKWAEKRRQVLERDGYACQKCGKTKVILQVHHRTYERIFNEDLDDLVTWCKSCHKKHHFKKTKPVKSELKPKKPAKLKNKERKLFQRASGDPKPSNNKHKIKKIFNNESIRSIQKRASENRPTRPLRRRGNDLINY